MTDTHQLSWDEAREILLDCQSREEDLSKKEISDIASSVDDPLIYAEAALALAVSDDVSISEIEYFIKSNLQYGPLVRALLCLTHYIKTPSDSNLSAVMQLIDTTKGFVIRSMLIGKLALMGSNEHLAQLKQYIDSTISIEKGGMMRENLQYFVEILEERLRA